MHPENKRSRKISVTFIPLFILCFLFMNTTEMAGKSQAADVPAVSEPEVYGVIDGEFGMHGLKGYYRWNTKQKWTKGLQVIRSDNTFGVANGEFEVCAMYVANATSTGPMVGFCDVGTIKGTSDEQGNIFYPPSQKATFSYNLAGNYIKYILMNNAYHLVGKGEKYTIDVVTKDGYLTCADGTDVSLLGVYAEEINESSYSSSRGYRSMTLYEPGNVKRAPFLGSYQGGRIVLNSDQAATIRSTSKLRLEDGTILLPNENGRYKVEVKDGLPVFVNATVHAED